MQVPKQENNRISLLVLWKRSEFLWHDNYHNYNILFGEFFRHDDYHNYNILEPENENFYFQVVWDSQVSPKY